MKHRTSFIKRLLTAFNLNNETTAQEKFEQFIKDQKHLTLLERIKAIRTNSPYEPDYDKPKSFMDVNIMYQDSTGEFKPISPNVKMTCERPEDFGNNIKAWKKFVSRDHKRAMRSLNLKEEKFHDMMREKYAKLQPFFNRMMRVE